MSDTEKLNLEWALSELSNAKTVCNPKATEVTWDGLSGRLVAVLRSACRNQLDMIEQDPSNVPGKRPGSLSNGPVFPAYDPLKHRFKPKPAPWPTFIPGAGTTTHYRWDSQTGSYRPIRYSIPHDEHLSGDGDRTGDPGGTPETGGSGTPEKAEPCPGPSGSHPGSASADWGPRQVIVLALSILIIGFCVGFIVGSEYSLAYSRAF